MNLFQRFRLSKRGNCVLSNAENQFDVLYIFQEKHVHQKSLVKDIAEKLFW